MAEACCFSGNMLQGRSGISARSSCIVSVVFSLVQTSLAHSQGIRLEKCLPVGELTGTSLCFSKDEKKNTLFCQNKRMGKEEICSAQLVILGKYKVCPKYPIKSGFSAAKGWNCQKLTLRLNTPLLDISTGSGMSGSFLVPLSPVTPQLFVGPSNKMH